MLAVGCCGSAAFVLPMLWAGQDRCLTMYMTGKGSPNRRKGSMCVGRAGEGPAQCRKGKGLVQMWGGGERETGYNPLCTFWGVGPIEHNGSPF